MTSELTRRQALTRGGVFLAGSSALLAACGNTGATAPTSSGAGGKPSRGGTLTVGMITGGSTETVNPEIAVSFTDILRTCQLFDFLFTLGENVSPLVPGLALSADSNADATVWTLKLRPAVTWHDGKPFTSDDVVWTIKSWASSTSYANAYVQGVIDFGKVRSRGTLSVEIPLLLPIAQFPSLMAAYNLAIVQNGATSKSLAAKPIGTGPFKFVSFTPGSTSTFSANTHYWQSGKPYVDTLVVNSTFTNESTRLDALLSGAIDVSPIFPFALAKSQRSTRQLNILNGPGAAATQFAMRVDKGPFTDPRVRQAMKLAIDRQALVANALDGYGQVGNDVFGKYSAYYATDLVAQYDVEKAKSLLKSAGQSGLTVTLQTAPVTPGFVEASTLFAEQAAAAGITIHVQVLPAANFYTASEGFLTTRYLGQNDNFTNSSLTQAYREWFTTSAPYDETGWATQSGGGDQKLINQAMAATNPSQAQQLWHEVQHQQFTLGGDIVYTYTDWVDAAAPRVKGMTTSKAGPVNNYNLLNLWVE